MNIQTNKYFKDHLSHMGYYKDPATIETLSKYLFNNTLAFPIVFCVGTDRCIGDALGPLTGSILKKHCLPFPVYGTIEDPIHALNIVSSLNEVKKMHPSSFIIALDASLGSQNEIGNIVIRKSPLFPGKGVGKKLPAVGDISIVGIVEDVNCDIASSIHNIRLSFIMALAEVTATIIIKGLTNHNSKGF